MSEICKYKVGCISFKEKNKSCLDLKTRTQGCVRFNEKETGINYGCLPCSNLQSKKCKGSKPGAFYYPDECPEFYNEYEQGRIEMEEEYNLDYEW